MQFSVVTCRECGRRNRIPRDAWSAGCGHCAKNLSVPGAVPKLLRAKASAIATGAVVLAMLGLLASGAAEMWQASDAVGATDAGDVQGLSELAPPG